MLWLIKRRNGKTHNFFILLLTFNTVVARYEAISGIIGNMEKNYYIYILTNKNNTVLYTGVTNDLKRRVKNQ